MSKNNPAKKKVVIPTQPAAGEPAKARTRTAASAPERELTFGKDTYIWMGAGLALIALGMILMSGGAMPNPETWDPSIIYSPMRVTVAPMVILLGLAVEVYAIFKK